MLSKTLYGSSDDAHGQQSLLSRNTILILCAYQIGMTLGDTIPASFRSLVLTAAVIGLLAYVGLAGFFRHRRNKATFRKRATAAARLEQRICKHVSHSATSAAHNRPVRSKRMNSDFVAVLKN